MDVAGTCHGFEIRSSVSFEFLRDGPGQPLTVTEPAGEPSEPVSKPILEWLIRQDGVFHARLFEGEGRFQLWIANMGWYLVDPAGPSISLPRNGNSVKREARLWGLPTILCFIAGGGLALHAAAVEVEGQALLLAAPGTFGKTTLAAAFARAGYRVLSEDLSCLRVTDEPVVSPGPALLRVRRDVAEQLELPAGSRLDGGDERVYLALDPRSRGTGTPVPLRAVVLLRTTEGSITLDRVQPADALRDLWALSFTLPTNDDRTRSFQGLAELTHRVPVVNLHRPLRLEELDRTVEHLVAGV